MTAIADILSTGRVFLAPMAGVTEAPFRGICKEMGAALTCTEMVSATGLHYNPHSGTAEKLLRLDPAETPAAVQVFGSDPRIMSEAAAMILERLGDGVAVIDVNMGCPVGKVVKKGEGSALMREPARAAAIVRAVVDVAGDVPVTVKFRKGWDSASVNAVEFARMMEGAGAAALGIHGRTRSQFYKGAADWATIAEVKRAVEVPVFGSGDVFCARDVGRMFELTGVDAVMVARGALGNPWIFREACALLEDGAECHAPTPAERVDMAREHSRRLVEFAGERAFVRMRKHVVQYVAGLPGASTARVRVNDCRSWQQLDDLLREYGEYVAGVTPRRREANA